MNLQAASVRIRDVFRREPWWAEFWSSVTAISWAMLSFVGPENVESWPSMGFLLRLSGDQFWPLAGFCLGMAQFVGLAGDWRCLRWGGALAMGWFWAVLTLGVWIAVPWAPVVVVYGGWCGINVFSILRLMRFHG